MPDLTPEEVQQIREFAKDSSHPAGDLVLRLCDSIDHLREEHERLSMAVGRFEGGLDLLANKLGAPDWPVVHKLIEQNIAAVHDVLLYDPGTATGKVLWRGKTGPLPGVDNERVSLITAEIPPGTEVAVVLTGEPESDAG